MPHFPTSHGKTAYQAVFCLQEGGKGRHTGCQNKRAWPPNDTLFRFLTDRSAGGHRPFDFLKIFKKQKRWSGKFVDFVLLSGR